MLKELKANHREIARLKFEGRKPVEIAEQMEMSISRVRVILADPMCKAHISHLSDKADNGTINIRKKFSELAVKAVDTIEDLLTYDNVNDSVKFKAAQDVLNRAGYAPVQESRHLSVHLTSDDLKEMKRRALAQGAIISDAEYEEVK